LDLRVQPDQGVQQEVHLVPLDQRVQLVQLVQLVKMGIKVQKVQQAQKAPLDLHLLFLQFLLVGIILTQILLVRMEMQDM
jgi:hypothetical protein